jgi:RNA polymerase sigma factor (sigma-70 family)
MHDEPSPVAELLARARDGDQQAWNAIVKRYASIIWATCRRYRLSDADAEDVSQAVWLYLVSQLGSIRDPSALPGWLATTTARECCRVLRKICKEPRLEQLLDAEDIPDDKIAAAEDAVITAERDDVLHEAFSRLSPSCQRLLTLLMAYPEMPYAEISQRLGIAVGSIGPIRRRCLDRLRDDPAIARLAVADRASGQPAGRT